MDNYLKSKVLQILENQRDHLSSEVYAHIAPLFHSYDQLLLDLDLAESQVTSVLDQYLTLIKQELVSPKKFDLFHTKETEPVDYYHFSKQLLSPFINKDTSKIFGKENIAEIIKILERGENVILLSNHQAEADPTLLAALLDEHYPNFIEHMIAIAGSRVTTDPITIPLSRGQNIICVYSKKYFELYADRKNAMQQHNSSSMITLRHVLNEGGKLVFVAPSGGRDRRDDNGKLTPAPFDPESIELMRLLGSKSKRETHYFPLALHTYNILPPPEKIKKAIGEQRKMCHCPIHVHFGKKYPMCCPSAEEKNAKELFRINQAGTIHKIVKELYDEITAK